jgi:uncharacterized membrane protein
VLAVLNTYYVVKSIHTMSVIATFGVAFVYPVVFAVTVRHDPRSLPAMHRLEYTIERLLILPGLMVVVLTGADTTGLARHWGKFFVQWGLGAVVVIGVVVAYIMIPTAERAAALAERDLEASAEGAIDLSEEYRVLAHRLLVVATLLCALVLITTLFMAIGLQI